VLTEQKINAEEIAILLNWFDKVRIGLWLGYVWLPNERKVVIPQKNTMIWIFGITQKPGSPK